MNPHMQVCLSLLKCVYKRAQGVPEGERPASHWGGGRGDTGHHEDAPLWQRGPIQKEDFQIQDSWW